MAKTRGKLRVKINREACPEYAPWRVQGRGSSTYGRLLRDASGKPIGGGRCFPTKRLAVKAAKRIRKAMAK